MFSTNQINLEGRNPWVDGTMVGWLSYLYIIFKIDACIKRCEWSNLINSFQCMFCLWCLYCIALTWFMAQEKKIQCQSMAKKKKGFNIAIVDCYKQTLISLTVSGTATASLRLWLQGRWHQRIKPYVLVKHWFPGDTSSSSWQCARRDFQIWQRIHKCGDFNLLCPESRI